ncbi:hypothetical protein M436DRAFT_58559 [Aureobasidium namibiae CBS 147.97]|uniref:Uncharacterized protein n=1 Tax=Aureobasidium namibiae CBS 147.97 TaxID=1043004 RepID=A0A074WA05_9PEZI|nr:uncharacterized protein M436DRAFT_58559 [Aureobasidium namibiae CBS 147.97]KEQ68439.1 hypothetical protein M436DRAFT_58559 [Aureobasidium namibiae CBS 147.97]
MLSTALKLLSVALLGSRAAAQTVEPFILDGRLDSATASDGTYNSGGTISVNGYSVTIPQNLQVQFPAAFSPFKDFASANSFIGHEVSVIGNVVNGKAIAGLVQIGEYLLQASSGTIESINSAAGTMKIKGGPTIRINDPNGVYSVGYKDSPLYTADDENPSITAFSGFPMCIPRSSSDPLCPSSNRPAGQSTFQAPDALKMAPFQVGDYLEYSGVNIGGTIVCYTIVAPNVQITTSGAPTFIRVEDAIVGIYDGGATSEFGDSRFIGYTSDPNAAITVSAIDVDPCTGEETERSVGSAPYKRGDARNKWEWRAGTTTTSKYTREYVIRASTGEKLTDNKINAGRYVQPVLEFLFPEPNVPGVVPPVNDFSNFPFLAQGLGYDQDGNLFGQLNPWPGASAPATKSCGPYSPPAASSAPASSAAASGTASADPSGTPSGTVTDPSAPSTPSSSPAATVKDVVTIDSYTTNSSGGGSISVTASTNIVGYVAELKVYLTNSATGTATTMTSNGNGKFSVTILKTKQPANGIFVTSNGGGSKGTTVKTA